MKISTRTIQTLLTEFLGTLIIVFITCWSYTLLAQNEIKIGELAMINGVSVSFLTWAGIVYSGAHFNPVITILKTCLQQMQIYSAIFYIGTQLVGSFLGTLLAVLITPPDPKAENTFSIKYPNPQPSYNEFQIFFLEFIGSFLYVLVYSATVIDKKSPSNIFGFAIGSVIILGTLVFGGASGACINPVRIFGSHLITGTYTYSWIYWLATTFGGLFAGFYYDFFLVKATDNLEIKIQNEVDKKNELSD